MTAAIITMLLAGFLSGVGLMIASKKFFVEKDPRIEEVTELLPAANCGACGFPGCSALAESIVKGKSATNACPVINSENAKAIAVLLGVEASVVIKKVARVRCKGGKSEAVEKYEYYGNLDCHNIHILSGGNKSCSYGCLGEGSCVKVCAFDAIKMNSNKIPVVDVKKCTACGLCVKACPREIICLTPQDKHYVVACLSKDRGAEVKRNCSVGCIGCRLCEKNCPVEAINIKDFLAEIDPKLCINCGKCKEVCPTKSICRF